MTRASQAEALSTDQRGVRVTDGLKATIRQIVEDALDSAIPEPWEVSEHATRRILASLQEAPAPATEQRETVTDARPLTPLRPRSDKPEWQQIIDLFRLHGLTDPPTRLRDELVTILAWARYAATLEAASVSEAKPVALWQRILDYARNADVGSDQYHADIASAEAALRPRKD